MANIEITATVRSLKGRGASRRLRGTGIVPGVLYGGEEPAKNIELDHKMLLMELSKEAFQASIITMEIDGHTEDVLLRDYQMHPWKKQILHVDFQRVSANQTINMNVPLHFINGDMSPGVKLGGGVESHVLTELAISCLPDKLPEFIEVDLSHLELGGSFHLSSLSLPEGVEAVTLQRGEDPVVASIQVPRTVVDETSSDGAVEGEGAPVEDPSSESVANNDSEKS